MLKDVIFILMWMEYTQVTPRIVPNAKKMNTINFEEMLELSSLGAKVLHTRSVQLALQYGVKFASFIKFYRKERDNVS